MRRLFVFLCAAWAGLSSAPVVAEDIGSVLQRSQQQRLDNLVAAAPDSPRAAEVRRSFALLLAALEWPQPVELQVVEDTPTPAETLGGHVVVASAELADITETERLFILAHELGHVALAHWSQMGLLFQKWVPGSVTQQHTDAVAALLGRDASLLAHQQEFEADAFAMRLLRSLGNEAQDVLLVFTRMGLRPDTATHPATRRRVRALLSIEQQEPAPR